MTAYSAASTPPGFWRTVKLLLGVARRRAVGRSKRQQELLRQRAAKKSAFNTLGLLGLIVVIIMMAVLHGGFAFFLQAMIDSSPRSEVERTGKIVVSSYFIQEMFKFQKNEYDLSRKDFDFKQYLDELYSWEADNRTRHYGGSKDANEKVLRDTIHEHGINNLVDEGEISSHLETLVKATPVSNMLGSLVLVWWFIMMIFQGEGLELDLQRRRHPMWEWLFSHPVPTGAVFFAEMLSPIAANPICLTAPIFWGVLFGLVYGTALGLVAALIIGVPMATATACLGKALEIGVILRLSPRSRGAVLGLMSWVGYAALMVFIFCAFSASTVADVLGKILQPLATISSWPLMRWTIGAQLDGSFSFLSGAIFCWSLSAIAIISAVGFSAWGAERGLSGNVDRADLAPSESKTSRSSQFGRDPLYLKELLWFRRDRSAIVQTILIPLTIASVHLFNMRRLVEGAQGAWNYLSGAAIVVGTYFLWVLGPKSLASEGPALWIALTWPRGLENLLKAKAWLWSVVATGVVFLVLIYAMLRFPGDWWRILLVGVGWVAFGRSMAEKAVTLVSVPSSSGEPEPTPKGRQWAASLGMLTFGIGILTQRWHIAIMGIVYSWITAAAMWQNFRARLPFLYDPWSEKLPPPPTLMHAMIAISILVEGGAIATGLFILVVGADNIGLAQAVMYGLCAVIVSLFVSHFLTGRGVRPEQVWCWAEPANANFPITAWWSGDGSKSTRFVTSITIGFIGGLLLGLLANGYIALLLHIPTIGDLIRASREQMVTVPGLKMWYGVIAVAVAPFAEEYLFRGLLFRALDREWGGWSAVLGSAAFFAIYHPPLAWIPVGIVGITNSFLFKKTGSLTSAVALHMAYNAVVVLS
ncbi:MAG: CPBP family intramembrane metalloprotease [Deltaproteobacteria bacterium]|nr:CPBP family intramembrane metalloprotease [Deltaproteobacteria bacterium]